MNITELIFKTLEANDALHLSSLVRWEWSERLTTTAGQYHPANARTGKHIHSTKAGLVEFSIPLFAKATEAQQAETVVHEFCHMIVDHKYPFASAHGWEWRQVMERAGYPNASLCHTIEAPKRRNRVTRVKISCGCPDGFLASKNLMTRMRNRGEWSAIIPTGGDYSAVNYFRRCRRCNQYLKLPVVPS